MLNNSGARWRGFLESVRLRRAIASVVVIVVLLVIGTVWAPRAYAASAITGNTKWAIVLCKFSDVADEPQPPAFFRNLFTETGSGQGGLFDYWRDMSYGKIGLTGSQVNVWRSMSLSLATARGWTWPGARFDLIKECMKAGAQDFNYPDYYGIVAILNATIDTGAVGYGDVGFNVGDVGFKIGKKYGLVNLDPLAWNVPIGGQEMGHGYGLSHSRDSQGNPYQDGWDIMSTGGIHPPFTASSVPSGPGLNAAYRHMLGWIPPGRIWPQTPYTHIVRLAGLETSAGSGHLMAPVWIGITNDYYSVEFRRRLFWDRNIPRDAVLVRKVIGSDTYLQTGNTGKADLVPGDYFASAADNIMIGVLEIDSANSAAVVKIGPYPSGTTLTSATVTPPPNTGGWSNANTKVTLTTTASISGVQSITYGTSGAQRIAATTVPASSTFFTISKEGETTAVYSATGNDGHPEFPRKLTLKLDKTAPRSWAEPVTQHSPGVFTVELSATDNAGGSGLRHITYEAWGAQPIAPTSVAGGNVTITISAAGQTSLFFWATDNANNSDGPHSLTFKPIAQVTPASLTFSSPVGLSSSPQSVTLKNVGQTTLTIGQVLSNSYAFPAQQNPNKPCGTSLAPGAECLIDVGFYPFTSTTYSDTLHIVTNTSPAPTVILTGTGTVPAVEFTPHALSFPTTLLRDSSQPQTATIKNTGQAPLVIIAASTGVGTDFLIYQDNCDPKPKTLQPGGTCDIKVAFRPRKGGALTGGLTLTDNALGGQHTLPLDGVGMVAPAENLNPASLDFGSQPVNTTGAPLTVVLTNAGTANLHLFGVALGGTNSSDFSIAGGTCNPRPTAAAVVVPPEGTCDVVTKFTPTAVGKRSADLLFATNVPSSPQQSVPLSGIGTRAPEITLNPTSLVFASWPVNSVNPSLGQLVTLTNNGSKPLTVGLVRGDDDFVIVAGSDTCSGVKVAVKGTCTVEVAFAPRAIGARSAELLFFDKSGFTHTVALAGTGIGPVASFDPPSLSFPALPLDGFAQAQEVTLRNVGNAGLIVSTVSVTGDFKQTTWCSSVAPGSFCAIRVVFRPLAVGPRSGQVIVSSDAAGSPHTVALTGTGYQAGVTLSPASLVFASQPIGTTSALQQVTLDISGTGWLNIKNITTSGDFQVVGHTCTVSPGSQPAGTSCVIEVTFKPATAGPLNGVLTVASNAPGSPHTVALSGSGR